MKEIIFPIQFTHSADMDGVGCALITKCLFNGETRVINGFDRVLVEPYIIPVGNSNIEKYITEFDFEKLKKFMDDNLIVDYSIAGIRIICIITDIYIPDDDNFKAFKDATISLVSSKFNKLVKWCKWEFDHHASNPNFGLSTMEKDLDGFPLEVSVCRNYDMTSNDIFGSEFELFVMAPDDHEDPIGIRNRYVNMFYLHPGMWKENSPERSATYIYFRFLHKLGLLFLLDSDVFFNLCRVVYHISNYDTFEFSKEVALTPIIEPRPDALTVLFKSYHANFFKVLSILYDALLICTWLSKQEPIEKWLPLNVRERNKLDFLYEEREDTYVGDLKSMKKIPYKVIKNNLKLDYDEIEMDDLVAVFPKNILDASYTGNRVLQENPDVKMCIMMYTDSRTISMRSYNRDPKAPNCKNLAILFNGGGHKYAAGFTMDAMKFTILLNTWWDYIDKN